MLSPNSFFHVEPLEKSHERKRFSCGVEALDRYFHTQVTQDVRRHITTCFVLVEGNFQSIVGYYTLSAMNVEVENLPKELIKKLPKYPLLPVTLLGRLALDKQYQGKKLGEFLLVDALKRSLKASKVVASLAVLVEAKSEEAAQFYKHFGFIVLPKQKGKLFLPMSVITKCGL